MKEIWSIPKIRFVPVAELDESRPVSLVSTPGAWEAVGERVHLPILSRIEVSEATERHWRERLDELRGEVVYAVGGGLAADAAKYLAARRGLPLICLPTAVSVDAFFTSSSGVRRDGCVRYVDTKPPDGLVVDFDVLATAPPGLRAAGICDVLSIATGCWDWRYAEERGANPPDAKYLPYVAEAAKSILHGALDCAEAAGCGDRDGLEQLLDCLALEVLLCNLIGHARPEEGSEHYFAYAVENHMGAGRPHGELVGPGILLMARLQDQDPAPLHRALEACHVPLDRIPAEVVASTLRELPDYCRRQRLPHGLAHDLTDAMLARVLG